MIKKKKAKPEKQPESGLRILFADDETTLQELMNVELNDMGHQATICPDGLTACAALDLNTYDCLLVDLDMPGMNGIDVIAYAKEINPEIEAIVLTGKSSLETAVAALRQGVFDYISKPCKLVELRAVFERVAEKIDLTRQLKAMHRRLQTVEGQPTLVGKADGIEKVRQRISRVATTRATVLIRGETGTGKELAARAVHDQSDRQGKPFVAINCGALPENLIESELFGHRKGAFTGADESRTGLFEVASGGTLFLDEIGELPKSMQAKLLRVLESSEVRRVGDNQPFQVDVRIVCATHRNLADMVDSGEFREDLMYRINAFEIELPALASRTADIPMLAKHLLQRFRVEAAGMSRIEDCISEAALAKLQSHSWPGNVRELANVIEHASILADQLPITEDDLPATFGQRGRADRNLTFGPMTLKEIETRAIEESLERHGGDKNAVASELGVSIKTIYNRLAALELTVRKAA
ncbi:MAG: sigma-54 dependent transcriptional regulator [Planctomycetota bacterium]|nr:sigma-54 dependent transcriptional regulator [Planctomycetota bacterium]